MNKYESLSAEELRAELSEQKILGLKMRVKGRPSNVRALDDLADRDLTVIFFCKQVGEG